MASGCLETSHLARGVFDDVCRVDHQNSLLSEARSPQYVGSISNATVVVEVGEGVWMLRSKEVSFARPALELLQNQLLFQALQIFLNTSFPSSSKSHIASFFLQRHSLSIESAPASFVRHPSSSPHSSTAIVRPSLEPTSEQPHRNVRPGYLLPS